MQVPSLPLRLVLAGAVAAVAVVGCAEADVTEDDFSAALVDDGVAADVADCITGEVFGALDQGEINDLYTADEATAGGQDAVDEATAACT